MKKIEKILPYITVGLFFFAINFFIYVYFSNLETEKEQFVLEENFKILENIFIKDIKVAFDDKETIFYVVKWDGNNTLDFSRTL